MAFQWAVTSLCSSVTSSLVLFCFFAVCVLTPTCHSSIAPSASLLCFQFHFDPLPLPSLPRLVFSIYENYLIFLTDLLYLNDLVVSFRQHSWRYYGEEGESGVCLLLRITQKCNYPPCSPRFHANTETFSPLLTVDVIQIMFPPSFFWKCLLIITLLWIMSLISVIGLLHFFYPRISCTVGWECVQHMCCLSLTKHHCNRLE